MIDEYKQLYEHERHIAEFWMSRYLELKKEYDELKKRLENG